MKRLGLDPQKVTKLAVKVHAHSFQYAYTLVGNRHALAKTFAANHHQDQEWGQGCTLRHMLRVSYGYAMVYLLYSRVTSSSCLLCHQPDSQI